MRKFARFIVKMVIYMIIILIGMLVMFYLMAPIYEFPDPVAFRGERLYNPYSEMDSASWKQYNFQVQSKAWGGITDGRKNSNELIDSMYQVLNFDHVATSDYQKINYHGRHKPSFIPTYEHGYNVYKTHQVCIGAKNVLWVDLLLFQTLSMKQWIIDQLDKDCEIVVLAHPLLRHGYTVEEMKYLGNYEMMEVLNNLRISTDHWDAALSSGQLVWLMGNDDAHDVLHPNDVGRKFTMINSATTNRNDIIANLKKGNSYGVDFYPTMDVPIDERARRIKDVPIVRQVELSLDTLKVAVDQQADEIHFIGQYGTIMHTVFDTAAAAYVVRKDDSYIRTVFSFPDGTSVYLNPVIRHDGEKPVSMRTAVINESATIYLRSAYFLVALAIIYFLRKRRQKRIAENT